MDTVFMNSKNSKTSDPHRLLFNLSERLNLETSDKYITLSNLGIYYTWKNTKMWDKSNMFKISTPRWVSSVIRNYWWKKLFWSNSKNDLRAYDNIGKIMIGQGDD